ncbi:type II toxin-antitoxin system RelE/ParE family toxin [Halochromatium roseum]|uniref:type II toxin-antitoxin system RelE/ParE family toxin n=1 Tax=Halochromatium roseum TaxID=391920 RepID=UPI0019115182|nr:plasmid stabilization protein ParE [Halochromatium roseum]MCF7977427.1 type II toxin-antitoxin system RelE/ParE family toxin [Chromatiaceae bacterium]MCF7994751.1 type II toxin-antitoxin system RelE/ParE family toxin [Chromatiaceae bacterium]MCF8014750.1 type II toxin-antitoxin system RelE/ParE family toxin [Chromatiaceae bacterium]
MNPYVLSELAEEDLIQIYVTGAMDFGLEQAKRYHRKLYQAFVFLADNPFAGPERSELRPACRIHPVGSHILIYTIRPNDIYILRVRHGHEDWLREAVRL